MANTQVDSREDRAQEKEIVARCHTLQSGLWIPSHEPQRLQILLPPALDETFPQEARKHLVMARVSHPPFAFCRSVLPME